MAKRSKKKKSTKRRSVGAMKLNAKSLDPIVKIGSVVLGLALAKKINPLIDKIVDPTKVDQKLVAGGQTLGGGFLLLKKLTKNQIANMVLSAVGGAVAGAGIRRGMTAFGLDKMAGYQDVNAVAGYQDVRAVGSGYRRTSRRPYTSSNGSLAGSGLMGSGLV
jgi:hypothetical protein